MPHFDVTSEERKSRLVGWSAFKAASHYDSIRSRIEDALQPHAFAFSRHLTLDGSERHLFAVNDCGSLTLGSRARARVSMPWSETQPAISFPIELQLTELSRLKDGWDGPNSRAPRREVIHDIELVVAVIAAKTRTADVEVDEDGNVILAWWSPNRRQRFELAFRGTGRVVGTLVSLDGNGVPAWRADATDVMELVRRMGTQQVAALIEG